MRSEKEIRAEEIFMLLEERLQKMTPGNVAHDAAECLGLVRVALRVLRKR